MYKTSRFCINKSKDTVKAGCYPHWKSPSPVLSRSSWNKWSAKSISIASMAPCGRAQDRLRTAPMKKNRQAGTWIQRLALEHRPIRDIWIHSLLIAPERLRNDLCLPDAAPRRQENLAETCLPEESPVACRKFMCYAECLDHKS